MKKNLYQLEQDEFGVHQKIIRWVGNNKEALEVGCASGYMSKEFAENGCRVTGIEIDPKTGRKAIKHCDKVIIGDIEKQSIIKQLDEKNFEIIILADVLEHLKDPERTLKNMIKLLRKEGRIIISVPNIAFLTNRLLLLLGRFDYTDWGIMDKTHLRFFTKKSIIKLVDKAGLKIKKFDYVANFTQLPFYMQTVYPLVKNRSFWRKIEYKIAGLWPAGLAVQFILIGQKKSENFNNFKV